MRGSLVLIPLLVTAGIVVFAEGAPARELASREAAWPSPIREGDLVFQDLDCGERCALIRRFTHSPYTHVGVVVRDGDERVVWEAYAPVGPTPLVEWVQRGRGRKVAVYRPMSALASSRLAVESSMRTMRGRPYDADYTWDDERIYCSELIAKAYRDALGRELVEPHPVSFGDDEARVRALSHGRLNSATPMVTPADLVRSGLFERVVDEL